MAATIITSFSNVRAVTQGTTNPATPPATVVVLSDGEGNLVGPTSLSGAQNSLTYPALARTVPNVGDTVLTTPFTALAVDLSITAFTGGTSPTVKFFLNRLGADGLWYPMWAPAVGLSAAGTVSVNVGPGQSGTATATQIWIPSVLTTQAQFGWTFTGSPTSVTFSASVVGRP